MHLPLTRRWARSLPRHLAHPPAPRHRAQPHLEQTAAYNPGETSTVNHDHPTAPACDVCAKPVDDPAAYVCRRCAEVLTGRLGDVVALAAEVETTVARLARYADAHGRPQPDDDPDGRPDGGLRVTPLPYDPSAATAWHRAANAITTWARHVTEERGVAPTLPGAAIGPLCRSGAGCRHESCAMIRARTVPHPVARAAAWLAGHLDWLRHRTEAAEAWRDLTAAVRTLVSVVDAPPPLWYAGPCWAQPADEYGPTGPRCAEELYARADAGTVRCPTCRTRHDVAERRAWLLGEADAVLAHAALIAAALSVLDRPVTSSQVRNLAHRRRIVQRGQDGRGRPLYRVGEVRKVLADIARRAVSAAA